MSGTDALCFALNTVMIQTAQVDYSKMLEQLQLQLCALNQPKHHESSFQQWHVSSSGRATCAG